LYVFPARIDDVSPYSVRLAAAIASRRIDDFHDDDRPNVSSWRRCAQRTFVRIVG